MFYEGLCSMGSMWVQQSYIAMLHLHLWWFYSFSLFCLATFLEEMFIAYGKLCFIKSIFPFFFLVFVDQRFLFLFFVRHSRENTWKHLKTFENTVEKSRTGKIHEGNISQMVSTAALHSNPTSDSAIQIFKIKINFSNLK